MPIYNPDDYPFYEDMWVCRSVQQRLYENHLKTEQHPLGFWQDNLAYATKMMQAIPPEQVDLEHWYCGTMACFGGHCTLDPFFQALGVTKPETKSSLVLVIDQHEMYWTEVAEYLFGDADLFGSYGSSAVDVEYLKEVLGSDFRASVWVEAYLTDFEEEEIEDFGLTDEQRRLITPHALVMNRIQTQYERLDKLRIEHGV